MREKLADFTLNLCGKDYVPLMVGGMGVDISTAKLALAVSAEGGIGHISDAMSPYLSDRDHKTKYQSTKGKQFKEHRDQLVKPEVKWAPEIAKEANIAHVRSAMEQKKGDGGIFINVMEKLTMGNPKETLKARLEGALDGGVDGITLSAGLHKGSMELMSQHPRVNDVAIGIIVSSARALKVFLKGSKRAGRLPDYVVVEGPLAGGHLGFGADWAKFDLKSIVAEVLQFLKENDLSIPVIPAGGIFTGSDAVDYMNQGASAVQVATRFTISRECGIPEKAKQVYIESHESDVEVNFSSPTGYPMRMLKSSPSLHSNIRPNCESLGYILDGKGKCSYITTYHSAPVDESGKKLPIAEKMCICTHFMNYDCYTCGHYVYRLKETTVKLDDGSYYLPSAAHIFNDYVNTKDHHIILPVPDDADQEVEKVAV
jgi:nitronate monooxygenase